MAWRVAHPALARRWPWAWAGRVRSRGSGPPPVDFQAAPKRKADEGPKEIESKFTFTRMQRRWQHLARSRSSRGPAHRGDVVAGRGGARPPKKAKQASVIGLARAGLSQAGLGQAGASQPAQARRKRAGPARRAAACWAAACLRVTQPPRRRRLPIGRRGGDARGLARAVHGDQWAAAPRRVDQSANSLVSAPFEFRHRPATIFQPSRSGVYTGTRVEKSRRGHGPSVIKKSQ